MEKRYFSFEDNPNESQVCRDALLNAHREPSKHNGNDATEVRSVFGDGSERVPSSACSAYEIEDITRLDFWQPLIFPFCIETGHDAS